MFITLAAVELSWYMFFIIGISCSFRCTGVAMSSIISAILLQMFAAKTLEENLIHIYWSNILNYKSVYISIFLFGSSIHSLGLAREFICCIYGSIHFHCIMGVQPVDHTVVGILPLWDDRGNAAKSSTIHNEALSISIS